MGISLRRDLHDEYDLAPSNITKLKKSCQASHESSSIYVYLRVMLAGHYCQGDEMPELYFLRHGAHYGALGALLNHKLRFTDKMAERCERAAVNVETLMNSTHGRAGDS